MAPQNRICFQENEREKTLKCGTRIVCEDVTLPACSGSRAIRLHLRFRFVVVLSRSLTGFPDDDAGKLFSLRESDSTGRTGRVGADVVAAWWVNPAVTRSRFCPVCAGAGRTSDWWAIDDNEASIISGKKLIYCLSKKGQNNLVHFDSDNKNQALELELTAEEIILKESSWLRIVLAFFTICCNLFLRFCDKLQIQLSIVLTF